MEDTGCQAIDTAMGWLSRCTNLKLGLGLPLGRKSHLQLASTYNPQVSYIWLIFTVNLIWYIYIYVYINT